MIDSTHLAMALDFLFLLVDFFLSAADLRDLATLAFLALDFPLADLAAGAFAGFLASFLPLPLVAAAFLPLFWFLDLVAATFFAPTLFFESLAFLLFLLPLGLAAALLLAALVLPAFFSFLA